MHITAKLQADCMPSYKAQTETTQNKIKQRTVLFLNRNLFSR